MSWQEYVDSNLVGTGKINKAAILGIAGGAWATSPGFSLSPAEQKAIVDGYSNPDGIRSSGLRIAGEKYFTLSVIDRTIQAKKGTDGVVIVKTKQAVLVAVYAAPSQAPEATPIVESLADYLISRGY